MQFRGGDDSNNEPSWPVTLFRYSESLGWQTQVGAEGTGTAIHASPRKDCIVIPALHQKFTLRSNNTNNGSNNGCSSTKDKGTVVRRNECILLISRNRTKVMVLQFRSLQDCLDFSDRFLALNDDDVHHPSDDDDDGDAEEERREEGSSSDEAYQFALAADRESVTAHLVRLVHEPSFEAFVRNVESSLQSTTDGEQILKSWVERDFGQSSPE
mmetsp:Transcript_64469/g.180261  ORF Transcript_64469/g.180261 Transcript_64469/m.180261 type:complete len:213 (+) Transcript_64469:56-694(+)